MGGIKYTFAHILSSAVSLSLSLFLSLLLTILISGCAQKPSVTPAPIILDIVKDKQLKEQIILPASPVCSEAFIPVNWQTLNVDWDTEGEPLFLLPLIEVESLAYNVSLLHACIDLYKNYTINVKKLISNINRYKKGEGEEEDRDGGTSDDGIEVNKETLTDGK